MQKSILIALLFLPMLAFSQLVENFSDGDFTKNPVWKGDVNNFIVNSENQLQSNVDGESKSCLATVSEYFDDAVWEFWVKIDGKTSSSNYSSVYIAADKPLFSHGCNGYYVQIGNTQDEISLYRQEGVVKTKIIDGTDKLIDYEPVIVKIKVTRSKVGELKLYRKLPKDADYVLEGQAKDTRIKGSKYFGVLVSNSKTTGKNYFFDDISISGKKVEDNDPPLWTNLAMDGNNELVLSFTEEVNIDKATFQLDNDFGTPTSATLENGGTEVRLEFDKDFQKGVIYTLSIDNIFDTSGNKLEEKSKQIGIMEQVAAGDLVINEILFAPMDKEQEYLEIYNTSDKVLDLSKVSYSLKKADGKYSSSYLFPTGTFVLPKSCLAITTSAESVRKLFKAPSDAHIVTVTKWGALSNTSAHIVLSNEDKSVIYDEVTYQEKWHNAMIRNSKGVSLERINPALPSNSPTTWHSAAFSVNYGTPGYQNSQYREINSDSTTVETTEQVWLDPEAFTPNNDGIDDVCFIRYKTEKNGYTANLTIFTPSGVKVAKVAENAILANEGYIIWDGKTDRGVVVNPGIYVLMFEMINVETGDRKVEKLPLVVSMR